MENVAMGIVLGLWGFGICMYCGLGAIADAIRTKNVEVNVKLPPIQITSPDMNSGAE